MSVFWWCYWAMVMQDGASESDWVHSLCTVSHSCLWICNDLKIKCLLKRKINCAPWKGDQTKLSLELGLNHQRCLVSESQSWRHHRENSFWWTPTVCQTITEPENLSSGPDVSLYYRWRKGGSEPAVTSGARMWIQVFLKTQPLPVMISANDLKGKKT